MPQAVPECALLLLLHIPSDCSPVSPSAVHTLEAGSQENTLWLSLLFEACIWSSAFVPNEHVDSFRSAVSVFESAELFMLIVSIKLLF